MRGVALLTHQAAERLESLVRVRVGIAWGLLFFNTLTFYPGASFLPIPGIVGKAIAQATLPAALLVILTINRKAAVRPNVFLCLVTLLVVGTILPALQPHLILTHARTALVAFIASPLVAGLSLIVAMPRVRKLFATAGAIGAVAVVTFSAAITTWLARGQTSQGFGQPHRPHPRSGSPPGFPRDKFQEIFGFGLSNASFGGFSIDSNWLSSYEQEGLYGVVVCAMIPVFMLVMAYFQPRGVRRALAL